MIQSRPDIRNIAIIAHVDHGKTTLVDGMLRQTNVFRANQQVVERVLDSNDLERERGITILAKNTGIVYNGVTINIVDTPGHADFGGEVERVMNMVDGVLLLVDAVEGPMPQTRFVLRQALSKGHQAIVVVNKIDRPFARPEVVVNATFDLFIDLGATDKQADFPVIYTKALEGRAGLRPDALADNLKPLFDTILTYLPPPQVELEAPARLLVTNMTYDNYIGKLAMGRLWSGALRPGQAVVCLKRQGEPVPAKISQVFTFRDLQRVEQQMVEAGDIVAVAGVPDPGIGDTIADVSDPRPLPPITVEEPTVRMTFQVNDSPFAGREGHYVTSRQLRERLWRELEKNVALRVEETGSADTFIVSGRGELHLAILIETMRREGYEFALGMPEVVTRNLDGQRCEPVERVVVDVPEQYVGTITTRLGERRGQMMRLSNLGYGRARMEYRVPSRGLIGFRSMFLTETRGTGLFNTLFDGWEPWGGPMLRRSNGAIVSDRAGQATPYALFHLQPRGVLFIGPGAPVYEGLIIGENNRGNDLDVNPTREKKLTNVREKNKDENVVLAPPVVLSIDTALEFIDRDELVEVTPDAVRVRKRVLEYSRRPRRRGEERN